MFPALVGMNRGVGLSHRPAAHVPRAGGDEPQELLGGVGAD